MRPATPCVDRDLCQHALRSRVLVGEISVRTYAQCIAHGTYSMVHCARLGQTGAESNEQSQPLRYYATACLGKGTLLGGRGLSCPPATRIAAAARHPSRELADVLLPAREVLALVLLSALVSVLALAFVLVLALVKVRARPPDMARLSLPSRDVPALQGCPPS